MNSNPTRDAKSAKPQAKAMPKTDTGFPNTVNLKKEETLFAFTFQTVGSIWAGFPELPNME